MQNKTHMCFREEPFTKTQAQLESKDMQKCGGQENCLENCKKELQDFLS